MHPAHWVGCLPSVGFGEPSPRHSAQVTGSMGSDRQQWAPSWVQGQLPTVRRFSGIERVKRKCRVTKDTKNSSPCSSLQDAPVSRKAQPCGHSACHRDGAGVTGRKQNRGRSRRSLGRHPHLRDVNDQEPDMESSRRKLSCRVPKGGARSEGGRHRRATAAEAP